MNQYIRAAIKAHCLISQQGVEIYEAWNKAIASFTSSKSSRDKPCPRNTFLGLAYGGYIKDVKPPEKAPGKNGVLRQRAIKAAQYVLDEPDIDKSALSSRLGHNDTEYCYDMVLTLCRTGLIVKPGP